MAQLAEKLNLTEEQKQALRDERARLMGDNRVDHGELREAHKALRQARKDNASEPEIAALSDRLQQLRAEHQAQREQMHESFLSILTPEQRERLAELKAERKAERKEQYRKGEHKHKKGHGKGRPDGGDAN
jgi:Spy/CpxP family protein refolding chaperone